MRLHRRTAAYIQFVPKHSDFGLVVLLHLKLVLLELVDLVPDQFHLLNLLRDLCFDLLRAPVLVVEFLTDRVEDLVETMVRLTRWRRTHIGLTTVLSSIEHGGGRQRRSRGWLVLSKSTPVW